MKITNHWKKANRLILVLLISLFVALFYASAWPESAGNWKFAVISDTQGSYRENAACINEKVVKLIAADIVYENPDLVLVCGDLVNGWFRNGGMDYETQYANWKTAMNPVYSAGIRVYPIRGNHDSGPERLALLPLPSHLEPPPDTTEKIKKAFIKTFPESYIPDNGPAGEERLTYSFNHKNAFIVGLDQYSFCQHKVNQTWLDRQLATGKQKHIFIFGHEPAFEVIHKDNLAFFPKSRDNFWDSIGKAGARIYFCGHDHLYNRAMIADSNGNQIRQIIAGTGGGGLRAWNGIYKDDKRVKGEYNNCDYHGYILVFIEGEKATVQWKALRNIESNEWHIFDAFTYSLSAN
jgi:hypothetical protein